MYQQPTDNGKEKNDFIIKIFVMVAINIASYYFYWKFGKR